MLTSVYGTNKKDMKAQTELIRKRLDGKIAVITGGNSGIGLATAQQLVEEDAYVFIAGRRQNELDKAVKQIGKNVTDVQGDISNLADLDRLYDTVKQQKGRIDILFANAGIAEFAPLGSITESLFDKIFNIHVRGSITESLFDKIFNIHSTKGASAVSGRWFFHFNCSWTVDLKNRRIRVNAISPGLIETPMSAELSEQVKTNLVSTVPVGRMGRPDEIAKAVAFLASDDSSYITGIELFVDGGIAQI